MRTYYGHLARVLHACTDQTMTAALAQMELTAAQSHILCYITYRKSPPCARDIEEAFQLSHPTVSGILSRLEQKEFIEMRPDALDRRCKRIYIREKALRWTKLCTRPSAPRRKEWCRALPKRKRPSLPICCAGP